MKIVLKYRKTAEIQRTYAKNEIRHFEIQENRRNSKELTRKMKKSFRNIGIQKNLREK